MAAHDDAWMAARASQKSCVAQLRFLVGLERTLLWYFLFLGVERACGDRAQMLEPISSGTGFPNAERHACDERSDVRLLPRAARDVLITLGETVVRVEERPAPSLNVFKAATGCRSRPPAAAASSLPGPP